MNLRNLLATSMLLVAAASTANAADEINGTLALDGSGSCIVIETTDGQKLIPDNTGGFLVGDQVHISGDIDLSCFSICFSFDGCVWNSVISAGWTIDECGVLVQDMFGCVLVEMADGKKYIPDDGGMGLPIGTTVHVTGDLDPSCGSICGPNDGCIWNTVTTLDCSGPAVGTPFCFGDGNGTACPCANNNDGSNGGAGCANSTNAGGSNLDALGAASVSADSVLLTATGVPAGQPGLFFRADNSLNGGNGIIFGDGLRCAGQNVVRLGTVFADASGVADSSAITTAGSGLAAGDTKSYQFWYRDPAGSPCGAFFNLSNGYEITWTF